MDVLRGGEKVELVGNPPEVGDDLPKFKLFNQNNEKLKTKDLLGKVTLISVVPNIDTPVCSIQTKHFNQDVDKFENVRFITVSNNTAQEQANWCAAEGVKNIELWSDYELSFGYEMKLYIPNAGFLARSIFIIDANGKVRYRQIVPEIHDEPDYKEALEQLKTLN